MKDLLDKLRESRAIYLDALAGAEDEESRWREAEGRWSVLDCAEHVANVEHRILRTLQKAPAVAPRDADPKRESELYARVSSGANRVAAPELVRPVGRYASLAEAAEAFAGTRERAIAFLSGYEGDLRAIGAVHPVAGPCNGYEYALIMAAHPIRHAQQIREIRQKFRSR